jgi:hypothetical protein
MKRKNKNMEKMIKAALVSKSSRSSQKMGENASVPADPWL